MQVLTEEIDSHLSLSDALNSHPLIIFDVKPEQTEHTIQFRLQEGLGFKAVSYYFHNEKDSYPTPKYINKFEEIPHNTYLLLTYDENGYTAYLCLSNQYQQSSMIGSSSGIELKLQRSRTSSTQPIHILICVRGTKLHPTVAQIMRTALKSVGDLGSLPEEKPPLPKWLGLLGWEAEGELSHDLILNSVWSLRQNDIQVGYAVIAEGWQSVAHNPENGEGNLALLNFEADPDKFPHGLKGTVEELHQAGVKHVGVWHSIKGSRGGLHPALAQKYDLEADAEGRYILGRDVGTTFRFFHDYYEYLKHQGIDFVKIGDQINFEGVTLCLKNLQTAVQASASLHFGITPLNTECLHNENLFYWTISTIAKAAENINFENPQGVQESIRNHLANSLWLQHIMKPDFGTWSSTSPHKESVAIFHALSGSVNVLQDLPGEHDKTLIRRLVLPSGKILQADHPLTLCSGCVFVNPLETKQVYKAFTKTGRHGLVAAFNLSSGKRTLHGTLTVADVEGLKDHEFAVCSHRNGLVGLLKGEGQLPITLKPNHSDVFTLAPLENGLAIFGFHTLYLAAAPLTEINIEEDSVHISSEVSGPLLLYCEKQILEIRRNGHVIPWEYDSKSHILSIDSKANLVETHSVYSILFEA